MARLNPPSSKAVVDISESLVERYTAQGWTAVEEKAKDEPKRKPGRPKKSE